MRNVVMWTAVAAIGLAFVILGPADTRADESGDPNFCYVGWRYVPSLTSMWVRSTDRYGWDEILVSSGKWVCG